MSNSLFLQVKFYGTQPCLFIYILSMAIFFLNSLSSFKGPTIWPAKPETFSIWLFTEIVHPSLDNITDSPCFDFTFIIIYSLVALSVLQGQHIQSGSSQLSVVGQIYISQCELIRWRSEWCNFLINDCITKNLIQYILPPIYR